MTTNTLPLFDMNVLETANSEKRAEFGTFKDSLRSPVHRWFAYPAGFSHKGVEQAIKDYGIRPGQTVYDPFVGSGTTQIVAKQQGIDSIGVEAHAFVYEVARIKLYWDFDFEKLGQWIDELQKYLVERVIAVEPSLDRITDLPELVKKCFEPSKLARLCQLKDEIDKLSRIDVHFKDLCWLGLASILRKVADVETGWPYIAPKKPLKSNGNKDAIKVFCQQLWLMKDDLEKISRHAVPCSTKILCGDARGPLPEINETSIDFAFTSPPYLNNYDYADRTRLETYFFGTCFSWGDISAKIRSKLITAATTQVHRNGWNPESALSDELRNAPSVYAELLAKVKELSAIRLQKGGKKDYDLMVSGYFNGMYRAMAQTAKLLAPGATFIMILGDSAPYGVFVPTEKYLGEIGLSVGFKEYRIEELRRRGGKWKKNPQRHQVALRESLLILKK